MRIAKQTYVTLAAGFGPWIPLNYMQATFNVALAVLPSSLATGASFSVQYTMDDQSVGGAHQRPVTYTQAAQTVTITDGLFQPNPGFPQTANGFSVGDSVTLTETGTSVAGGFTNFDGSYQIASIISANQYTVTVTPSQTVANGVAKAIQARVFTSTGIPAASAARIQTNLTNPCTAVRLAVAALTAGTLDFIVIQGD